MTDNNQTMPFGITREEILELAANKVADGCMNDDEIFGRACKLVNERIDRVFSTRVDDEIGKFLQAEIEKLAATTISAVNIWGEEVGPKTTLRDALAARARVFWEEKVDREGAKKSYGGQPRYEWMIRQVVSEEFNKAVKENAALIVAEFKKALHANCANMVAEHVERLVKP